MSGNIVADARRATVGQSALGWIATFCLIASGATWALMFRDLFQPTTVLSAQTLRVALLTIIYTFVLPLFVSMLAPTSPAGRLLQKTQWRSVGYGMTIAAALLLLYYGYYLTSIWFSAQPAILESGQAFPLTISSLIGTVVVPALSWAVVTPEQWIAQIEQARHVRWIERSMQLEEATAKAMHARALTILSAGLANATVEEKHELAGIMLTFYRQQQKAIQGVAQTFAEMHGIEMKMSTRSDDEIAEKYREVVLVLDDAGDHMSSQTATLDRLLTAPPVASSHETRPRNDETASSSTAIVPSFHTASGTAMERPRNDETARGNGSLGDPQGARAMTIRDGETAHEAMKRAAEREAEAERKAAQKEGQEAGKAYVIAHQQLSGAWKRADVERILNISKSQAMRYISAWIEIGFAYRLGEPKDHYEWATEDNRE